MDKGFWVGVDVGQSVFCAAVAPADAEVNAVTHLPVKSFAFSPCGMGEFVSWVRAYVGEAKVTGVCIESTGRLGWHWMSGLEEDAWPVAMVNPSRTRAFGESLGVRDKTDDLDARVLAVYGVVMRPRPTSPPSPQLLELRECNRLFMALVQDKLSYENRLLDGPTSALVRRELKRTIQGLERRMQTLQAHMDDIIQQSDSLRNDVERITSIKGVGLRTAYVLLAELGDLRQYRRNELVSFAGLYPRKHESGSSVYRKPRLVKRGAAPVRKALYLCAMSARVHNPQMRHLYERQRENGKCPMAALGILMRKLLLLARSLLINRTLYDPNYA
jgi:transposase